MAEAHIRMVAKLKAMSAVTDLVVARIHPVKVPQRKVLPYISYEQMGRSSQQHSTGTTTTTDTTIELRCWASTYDGAHALADAVRGDEDAADPTGLAGWEDSGSVGGNDVWRLENEYDEVAEVRDGRDEFEAHCVVMDFLV